MLSQVRDKDLKLFEDLAKDSFKTKVRRRVKSECSFPPL